MIDVSDGLLADAGHLADATGVAIDVRRGAFEIAEPLRPSAPRSGPTRCSFILGGGDDHALLATFPDVASVPEGWLVVGEVREGEGSPSTAADYDGPTGWTHF